MSADGSVPAAVVEPLAAALAAAVAAAHGAERVVLVEGPSDRAALEALAERQGRTLTTEGVRVVAMGGITNIASFVEALRPSGVRLAGLCDAAEERFVVRALGRVGVRGVTRSEREALGFFTCVADIEDELIRALGIAGVEAVLASEGELASYRLFQQQPAQRERSDVQQLHRFLGTRSMRKIRYGRLLVEALDPDQVPRPLRGALAA
ncbi:TOPRIM nucleotidyl transferase/hydrolase domain-containing protein [Luteipulveratus flavus]|uniref:ATP-dependent endonuclease n=1 Tax=Luteipulveratus flavus TaxID=3031728 RepID=A0ABT6C5L7_9MICO|nr:TOPRIM nucleotidyl transferase/hydrolase domain-containing protein [Luteipulveratus sp. YIM 133296]MDF8263592.1 ATP-dependent endonuclease [Luteipulveratus sp. YIM 133296]